MRILYVVLCLPEFLAYLWQIYLEKKMYILLLQKQGTSEGMQKDG